MSQPYWVEVKVDVEVDVDGLLLELELGKLLAISQGAPPPIKGMARASVSQPTTDNNEGRAQPAEIWHSLIGMKKS